MAKGEVCPAERRQHSKISTPALRELRSGKDAIYGVQDEWHCALDYMLDKGFIDRDQHCAGYDLRRLYYRHNVTGRWIDDGPRGHDGDFETDSDKARQAFYTALDAIRRDVRSVTRAVCVEAAIVPADFLLIRDIQSGLDDLAGFFKKTLAVHQKKQ